MAAAPTKVLKLLVVLASFHLQVELVLVRAEMEEILAGLVAVRLEQVFNPIRCVLKANLLFLYEEKSNIFMKTLAFTPTFIF